MKIRDILGNRKTRKGLLSKAICPVCGNNSNNLDSVSTRGIDNGATANSIYSDTINKISKPILPVCTNVAGEKTKGVRLDSRKPEPPYFIPDFKGMFTWEEWYKNAWERKISYMKNNYG